MNPFFYHNMLYAQAQGYTFPWLHHFPPQTEDFSRLLSQNVHSAPIATNTSGFPACNTFISNPQVIKVQESNEMDQIVKPVNEIAQASKKCKSSKRSAIPDRKLRQNQKQQIKTKHKAKYFDPTTAPLITSNSYNWVTSIEKQSKYLQKIAEFTSTEINEMNLQQEDSQPFIVFKHRRIKKKYKFYVAKHKLGNKQLNQNSEHCSSQNQVNFQHTQDFCSSQSQSSNQIKIQKHNEVEKQKQEYQCQGKQKYKEREAKIKSTSPKKQGGQNSCKFSKN